MPIDSIDPVLDEARGLPADWLEVDALPPVTPTGLKYSREWRGTEREARRKLVEEARTSTTLFVLWMWEPEAAVRVQIVKALERAGDPENTNLVLRKILREETPDEGGVMVRRAARQVLIVRAEAEAHAAQARGAVRTRGAIRARGAVRTRGAAGPPVPDRSARAILYEFEDLQAANPRYRT